MTEECNNCGKSVLECKCINIPQKSKEQLEELMKGQLKKDIQDLKEKLLYIATKHFKPRNDNSQSKEELKREARNKKKKEMEKIKNLLKERLRTYSLILKADEIIG